MRFLRAQSHGLRHVSSSAARLGHAAYAACCRLLPSLLAHLAQGRAGGCLQHAKPADAHVAGSDGSEVPSIFIDRVGAKLGIEETYSRNSKGSLSLVLQRVSPAIERSHFAWWCCHSGLALPR